MKRRNFIGSALALPLLLPLSALAQQRGFADYVKQQQQGFSDYQQQLEASFQQYRQTIDQEFASYKQQVNQLWGDQQIGSAKVLVRYSDDLRSREIIDFERSTITIEVIGDHDSTVAKQKLREQLLSLASATESEIQKDDVLEQRIREQMPANQYQQVAGKKDYVIADLLTGEQQPKADTVQQAVLQAASSAKGSTRQGPEAGMQVYSLSIALNNSSVSTKAAKYQPQVEKFAFKEQIDPALVMAIMHSESAFNPLARSHIPAYGLMQIVPESAGRDASQKVYGQQRLLSASYLYNSENNIKIGCAYLNILFYRYLKGIENRESRVYCCIAAYNTGAGNVARAFVRGTNINQAAIQINKMSAQQVYNRLRTNLPYAETRKYLPLVVSRYQAYQRQFDQNLA